MKSSKEIIELILFRMGQLYSEPEMVASDVGEVDVLLFQLHWLYATITETTDALGQALLKRSAEEVFRIEATIKSHHPIGSAVDALNIIEEWKRVDHEMGIGEVRIQL